MYTVFVLSCADDTYHCGITNNLTERLKYHQQGLNASNYTYNRRPIKLAFETNFSDIRDAKAFENTISEWSSERIKNLIDGNDNTILDQFRKERLDQNDQMQIGRSVTLPLSYLGNIAYFSILASYSNVSLNTTELFQKQTYRSRCSIFSANGVQNLIVPVERPFGKNTRMADVRISYAEDWQKKHIKAIESAYRRAPYYSYYHQELFELLDKKYTHLVELNLSLTQFLIDKFQLNSDIKVSEESSDTVAIEINQLMSPKNSAITNTTPYIQVFSDKHGFQPNLSALDLLFNLGPDGLK